MKTCPWADGRGNQEYYVKNVKLWASFHDRLPANNSNKIAEDLGGIALKSQLYGREKDICTGIPDDVIQSENGVQAILDAVYKRDSMDVVNEGFRHFNDLLMTKRGGNE